MTIQTTPIQFDPGGTLPIQFILGSTFGEPRSEPLVDIWKDSSEDSGQAKTRRRDVGATIGSGSAGSGPSGVHWVTYIFLFVFCCDSLACESWTVTHPRSLLELLVGDDVTPYRSRREPSTEIHFMDASTLANLVAQRSK